jgi:hypothetical protein
MYKCLESLKFEEEKKFADGIREAILIIVMMLGL